MGRVMRDLSAIMSKHKDPPEKFPAGPCSYEKEENEGVEED